MRWFHKIPLRLRSLFKRNRVEQELGDELRFHLDKLAAEKRTQGMTPEEARYTALRELGGVEQIKEECRDMRRVNYIENFRKDVRYGLRQLGHSPGFTAVAIATLALGIGANTAIFSLIDAVMLKALPLREPQQLELLNWVSKGKSHLIRSYDGSSYTDQTGVSTGTSFSYPLFEAIRSRTDIFSSVLGFATSGPPFNLNVAGQPGLAKGQYVSGDFFSTLGVGAALGRTILPSDDAAAAAPVAVISYAYWTRRFGRDPSVVGKAVTVNGVPFTLVGVTAPEFFGLQAGRPTDAWVPLQTLPQVDPSWVRYLPKGETVFSARTEWWVQMIGRLRPGVTVRQANAALNVILQQEAARVEPPPPAQRRPDMTLRPPTVDLEPASRGLDELRREFSQPLFVLMCLVGLVLLVACANVANLLLARAESRQREIAVRLALGAGRRRLVSQLLAESALLAAMGGACGIALAYWASGFLLAFMSSGGDQIQLSVSPDLRVLAFTAAVSTLTAILFGLAPALRGTRLDLTPALQGGGRVIGAGRSAGRMSLGLGKALVVMQAAMSLLLLIGSGLFVRTLRNLEKEDLGFDRSDLLLFTVDSSRSGYRGERLANVYQEMQRRIELLPGVRSATMSR
ncbi:MAG TPA: ABC transporter permease, partial [Terriglobia bacterium]|nr:ABC transporter permease [Terriglobia bacterium]